MKKRVVITGMGIVSSIGVGIDAVTQSLKASTSGIEHAPDHKQYGLRSEVSGTIDVDTSKLVERKKLRFMSDATAYCYIAMKEAIANAQLDTKQIESPQTGVVVGSGGASPISLLNAADTAREQSIKRIGPYMVTRTMGSTTSSALATFYGVKGYNYSISSACATSAHCIGHAAQLIQWGEQQTVFAGGGEEVNWFLASLFDAMGALSSSNNANPDKASRPYDVSRDGFVISGGAGIVVLEEMEAALARKAPIIAELVGYGASSDGYDMVKPHPDGAALCMRMAIKDLPVPVDYLNTHGTSTPTGDIPELRAARRVFGDQMPPFSSTKSLTGHAMGAAGVNEAICSLIMLTQDFISASANVEEKDPEIGDLPLVTKLKTNAGLKTVLSNSFGFGGTNAALVFAKPS